MRYTVKAGGVLMVLMGVSDVHRLDERRVLLPFPLRRRRDASGRREPVLSRRHGLPTPSPSVHPESTASPAPVPAPDFTLYDQNGVEHTLSDYQGKTVFLNFWATWCPPCKAEMPDIQALYEDWGRTAGR
ncbi:MAG: peroxiredoxin family protein [Intestinimonas sp.]